MQQYPLSRRAFLRGLGVTVALPWLESVPVWGDETAKGKASEPPVRFACLFAGNGFHSKEWWAKGSGAGMELGKVLEPLDAHKEKMLSIKGLTTEQPRKGTTTSWRTANCPWAARLPRGAPSGSGRTVTRVRP